MNTSILVTFIVYFLFMLGIGVYFWRKSKNVSDYFLGGRQLNSWVTAMSAQASDMSGWLLMGLPAAAYMSGISAGWIAIGLGVGTYMNWKFIAVPLRKMTAVSGDSITIPQYFQNRFLSHSSIVRTVCAVIIFVFFLIYTASAFNAGAVLFQKVFGWDYVTSLTVGSLLIVSYTFLGGFLAASWTDFFQGILMFFAIIIVPIIAIINTPGISVDGLAAVNNGTFLNLFANADGSVPATSIISNLAWGLGYCGMPHILTRFMAIKSSSMIKKSRIIAMVWVVISLAAAVLVGIVGYAFMTANGDGYATSKAAEAVFMDLVLRLAPGVLAGLLLSAIMAAVMSTADSQLLVAASAVSNDFYKTVVRKHAGEKELMWVSRGAVLAIAVLAYVIAFNPNNTVMGLVSYAWAGFGAAFGPAIVLSLFWKRMTLRGAIAGMVGGGALVLLWETLKLEAATGIYSLLPGFFLSLLLIVVVSRMDKAPSKEVTDLFEQAKATDI